MDNTLKIALIGSRGIPAKYGGNESITEELAQRLTKKGWKVYVTCESKKFHIDDYNGIIRVHTPSFEGKTITIPSLNDIIATYYLLLKYPDIKILCYTSFDVFLGAIIPKLLGKKIIMNTDGIEWKRPIIRRKYLSKGWKLVSILGSWYLKWMEKMAPRLSNIVIADAKAIKTYLEESYKAKNVIFIPYGARELIDSNIPLEKEYKVLNEFGLSLEDYYLTVARIVAENNIHQEIEGFKKSGSNKKLFIVGNFIEKDGYTKYLTGLRNNNSKILFSNPIYDKETLGILRKNCYAYIHAYELGGTNPSLLEQMFFKKPILAYDVPFHREILQKGGIYFMDESHLAECIKDLEQGRFDLATISEWQAKRLDEEYNWDNVAEKYSSLFKDLLNKK